MRTRLSVVRQPSEDDFHSYGYGSKDTESLVNSQERSKDREAISRRYATLVASMKEAFEAAFVELEKPEYIFNLRNSLKICELHFEHPSYTSCCGIASNHIIIQDDGRLASCPMTIRETNTTPSHDLFSSIQATFPYRSSDRNLSSDKNCLDCRWFPVCISGCPVNNLRINGSPFTISPLHDFYEYVIPRYINFFGVKLMQQSNCGGRSASNDIIALSI